MSIWSDTGYVTDMPFVPGFYPEILPETLNACLSAAGLTQPTPGGARFRYIDIGAGYGMTTALIAALYPECEVYCVDFLAEHTAQARAFRDKAQLANLHVLETSFADLPTLGLAPFDYVCANAVASWVGERERHQILGFARDHLAAQGCFFLSYNAYPGMANVAPLQRLILQLVEAAHGTSVERMAAAIGTIEEMYRRGSAFLNSRPDVREYLAEFQTRSANYLVHEYLHRVWNAFYAIDMVRELADFGMVFAGGLGAEDLEFATRGPAAPRVRPADLQLHDFMVDRRYRRDLFVRRDRKDARSSPPDGATWRLVPLIAESDYRRLIEATPFHPLPDRLDGVVREAANTERSADALARHRAVAAFLLGRGALGLADNRAPSDSRVSVQRYNAAVFAADPGSIDGIRPLAIPGLSGGIRVSPTHHRLLRGFSDADPIPDALAHLAHLLPIPS